MYILINVPVSVARHLKRAANYRGTSAALYGGMIVEQYLNGSLVRRHNPSIAYVHGVGSAEKPANFCQSAPAALDIAALSKKRGESSFLKPVISACESVGKPAGPLLVRGG